MAIKKPIKEYIFRPIGGQYIDVSTNKILADVLLELNIILDDKTEFARIRTDETLIFYRAYTGAKITIEIWKSYV